MTFKRNLAVSLQPVKLSLAQLLMEQLQQTSAASQVFVAGTSGVVKKGQLNTKKQTHF